MGISKNYVVTPLAGVWIEIRHTLCTLQAAAVTPLAGVWIEIAFPLTALFYCSSLPLRECGLKFQAVAEQMIVEQVTPLAGVWIEIDQIF